MPKKAPSTKRPQKAQVKKSKEIKTSKAQGKTLKKMSEARLSIPVYDMQGKKKESVSLPKEIQSGRVSERLIAQYVRVYRANRRQGTAQTKTRGQIVASKRKIWRQKGTGRARHGARSAPIFVGGGVAFGPQPRDFSLKLNKKQRQRVFETLLAQAAKGERLLAVADTILKMEPKTKKAAALLKKLALKDTRLLVVLAHGAGDNFEKAVRNIPTVSFSDTSTLNAYELLRYEKILFVKGALLGLIDKLQKRYAN